MHDQMKIDFKIPHIFMILMSLQLNNLNIGGSTADLPTLGIIIFRV